MICVAPAILGLILGAIVGSTVDVRKKEELAKMDCNCHPCRCRFWMNLRKGLEFWKSTEGFAKSTSECAA